MKLSALAVLVACGGGSGTTPAVDAPSHVAECSETTDTCTSDTICIGTTCEVAYPRLYLVSDIAVHVPVGFTHEPDGKPDLEISAAFGNPSPFMTAGTMVAKDTFDITVPAGFELNLMASTSSMLVGVNDVDPQQTTMQSIVNCVDFPVVTQTLRNRRGGCANGQATISFKIDPIALLGP